MNVRNDAYLKAFGENLEQLMARSGKNAATVAALGSIETKQVYRVVNGEHSATLSIIYAIAKGLDVHPKELFDFTFQE